MGYRSDITGVDQTCPTIDSIKDASEELLQYMEPGRILSNEDVKEVNNIVEEIHDLIETVRDANSRLRDVAIDMSQKYDTEYDRAEEAEDKAHRAIDECESYKRQLIDERQYA